MKAVTGQRQKSKGERFEQLEKQVANQQMATRLAQMLVQQLLQQNQSLKQEHATTVGMLNDMQYRLLALQSLSGLPVDTIKAKADELRLKDYNAASDKEDAEKGYTAADEIGDNSVVIISSTTPNEPEDKGIFRSKFVLAECGHPGLIDLLKGKKVGDKVAYKLGDTDHEIEVIGIRNQPEQQEEANAGTNASTIH